MADATPIPRGGTVEGWVARRQPRYYRLDLAAGERVTIAWYTRIVTNRGQGPGLNPVLAILDEHGGKKTERMEATYATVGTGSFDEETISYRTRKRGAAFLQVGCEHCGKMRVHYKLVLQ